MNLRTSVPIFRAFLSLALSAALLSGCEKEAAPPGHRIVIDYWEKWTGFEGDAMKAVVDDYNASQDRVFVDYVTVSQPEEKLMLSMAGGVPPDLAGVWAYDLPVFAENNALMPLDKFAAQAGISRSNYIDVFWRICTYRGHLWALPTTPGSIGLIWNKKLFRAAGLDPNRPPRSIAELEQDNEKLLKRDSDGRIISIGHLPSEPGWYADFWGYWFGGSLWDGKSKVTANCPGNIAAGQWIASYPKRFGADQLLAMQDGFGTFASPQNAFFTGKVAMVLQGPWIYNFIKNYAPPDFEWGVAPFPSVDPRRFPNVSIVESDVIVIPTGSRHPREAFDFIRYVNSQGPMEKLCLGQRKFSPLRDCSPDFLARHPNPYIREFIALAKSPNAHFAPQMTIWRQYSDDLTEAFGDIWRGRTTPEAALDAVQRRDQAALDRRMLRWNRLAPWFTSEWNKE